MKVAFRNFRNNVTPGIIKILGLSVSLSAVFIIWSYVINENKYDSGIPNSNRVYRLDAQWASMPPFIGHILNQNLGNEMVAARLNFVSDIGIQVNNVPFNLKDLAFADSTFFKVLALKFIAGDPEEALNKPYSLVLSEATAKRLFGTADALGKIIRFENQADFTVTGIIKDYPFMHLTLEVIASIVTLEKIGRPGILQAYDGWSYPTYLILPEGADKTRYETKIREHLAKFRYDENFHLKPFDEIYYSHEYENESNTKHGNLLYNRVLVAVSIFILLLAAINFINMTIANAVSRSREVSFRKLQGASKTELVIQFLFETAIFIFAAILLCIIFLWFLNPLLTSLTGFSVNFSSFLTNHNLIITITGLLIFIAISGIYPSIYISSFTFLTDKRRITGSPGHIGIRNGLIIFQNLVSVSLIICTLIANRQFRYMNRKDLGFNKNGVVILKLNSQLKEHMDLFRQKLLTSPEISSVSFSSRIPGNYWGSWCCVNIEGKENKYFNNYVDPDYLKTLEIKLKEGRNFSYENPGDLKATYMINETGIKMYDLKNPIGQIITPGNGIKGTIIGIFRDFHYRGLNYEQTPLILFYTPEYKNYINIRLSHADTKRTLEKIRNTWDEVCPAFSFEYRFLDEIYDEQYSAERKFEGLIFSFAMLALLIAGIGLYGLSVYSIERRTKEIGIRKVNGASISGIMIRLNRGIVKWVIIAFLLASPIALYSMNKWLQKFPYRADLSWIDFVLGGLIALVIVLLSVSLQSWRAATRNPVEVLRYE
ncbi:MAG: ABC transporter permease [Bacteroidota bacterium]|nr:ABC transporter permease [Bacteroidota bacterium]